MRSKLTTMAEISARFKNAWHSQAFFSPTRLLPFALCSLSHTYLLALGLRVRYRRYSVLKSIDSFLNQQINDHWVINIIKNRIIFYKTALLISIIASGSVHASCLGDTTVKPIKAYIVPQLTASQTYTQWGPVLDRVGKSAQLCFDLVVPATIPQFEADLANGRPDFVFMNPYHVVMKWREHQYVPLVASSEPIFGVLTVKKDSKYIALQDLSYGKVAFPAPNSFAASLLIRSLLANNKIPFEPVYVKTHSNVYRSVVRGDVAVAGGGIESTLLAEPSELKDELRVLAETKRYTSHPFSANARVPRVIQERVQTAFLNLAKTSDGAELLSRIQMAKPMAVSYKVNYQALEALKLDQYVVRSAD